MGPQSTHNFKNAPQANLTASQRSVRDNQIVPSLAPSKEKSGQWMSRIQVPSQKPSFLFNSLFLLRLPPYWVSPLPFSSLHIHLFCTWTRLYCPLLFICSHFSVTIVIYIIYWGKKHHCLLSFFDFLLINLLKTALNWLKRHCRSSELHASGTSCTTTFPVPGFDTSRITPLLSYFSLATHFILLQSL